MPCGVRLRAVAHRKSVVRGQNGEGKLLYSVDAPIREEMLSDGELFAIIRGELREPLEEPSYLQICGPNQQ